MPEKFSPLFLPPRNFPQSDLQRRADSRWALPQISSLFIYLLVPDNKAHKHHKHEQKDRQTHRYADRQTLKHYRKKYGNSKHSYTCLLYTSDAADE